MLKSLGQRFVSRFRAPLRGVERVAVTMCMNGNRRLGAAPGGSVMRLTTLIAT